MVGESNQNVFLIQKDASSFAEFEISKFEISRVDCMSIGANASSLYWFGRRNGCSVCWAQINICVLVLSCCIYLKKYLFILTISSPPWQVVKWNFTALVGRMDLMSISFLPSSLNFCKALYGWLPWQQNVVAWRRQKLFEGFGPYRQRKCQLLSTK